MLKTLQQPEDQQDQIEQTERRRMRWFVLISVIIWLLASMIAPVVSFCVTRSPLSFTLFAILAPPVSLLFWVVKYLFRDDKDYWIAMLKIQYSALQQNKQTGFPTSHSLPATRHQAKKEAQKKYSYK